MSTPGVYRKDIGGFRPVDRIAEDYFRKIRAGDEVMLTGRRPRNLKHHRKFWALMNLVAENQSVYPDAEALVRAFKIAIGHCEDHQVAPSKEVRAAMVVLRHMLPNQREAVVALNILFEAATTARVPSSISFAKMDQTEFEAFYEKAIQYCTERVVPGLPANDLRREVELMLAG